MRGIRTRIAYIVLNDGLRPAESSRSNACRIGFSAADRSGRGSYAFDRAAHATILADGSKRTRIETEQGARVDPG
ncbi:hypothetical protein Y590_03730 [Methylobacterium sp. AMS5]|nr:hypothetical protein Y590_03730 [Methylobacterium sp. AMS5]